MFGTGFSLIMAGQRWLQPFDRSNAAA